jgi:tRNA pseudouridine38/39 synthase
MHDFKGRHNFINFCKMNLCNTVNFEREIKDVDLIKVENTQGIEPGDSRNEMYYFRFVGNSFLWHQIRYMVSVLFMIGQGTEPPNVIKDLLSV